MWESVSVSLAVSVSYTFCALIKSSLPTLCINYDALKSTLPLRYNLRIHRIVGSRILIELGLGPQPESPAVARSPCPIPSWFRFQSCMHVRRPHGAWTESPCASMLFMRGSCFCSIHRFWFSQSCLPAAAAAMSMSDSPPALGVQHSGGIFKFG